MNKICGYSCEHNKSGVCQISICDKKTYMLDKTEIKHLSQSYYDLHEKYYKLQQENKKLNGVVQTYDILLKANVEENKQLKEELECTIGIVEHNRIISKKNKEIHQLKDNWSKLKEWLEKELGDRINPNKDKWLTGVYDAYKETIDKMQELERSDSDGNN